MAVGKVMVEARPGALAEILKRQSKTQVDIADATQTSRKTIQSIINGKPVKDTTLKKVADHLRVPIEHLLPNKSVPVVVSPNVSQAETPATKDSEGDVLLQTLDGKGILEELDEPFLPADRIKWQVDARLEPTAIPHLRELEKVVSHLHSRLKDLTNVDELDYQLRRFEAIDDIDRLLKMIRESKLNVLGGSYLYWNYFSEREQVDEYFDRIVPARKVYTSEHVVCLCIDGISVKSKRVSPRAGSKPPKFSPREGPEVWVNGKRLPFEPIDDDIPF
jgi:transcriptional regulator with XRE-family HTH domain